MSASSLAPTRPLVPRAQNDVHRQNVGLSGQLLLFDESLACGRGDLSSYILAPRDDLHTECVSYPRHLAPFIS
jgi:hypothetical protein